MNPTVIVDISGKPKRLQVFSQNAKTIWVWIGSRLIKRHKVKHNVQFV